MTHQTHIIKQIGTEIVYSQLTHAYYQVGEKWFKILLQPTETNPLQILLPSITLSWTYTDDKFLATNGIYSRKDIIQLKDRIMFPIEKPALVNNIVREMSGYNLQKQVISAQILKDQSVSKLANRIWDHIMFKFLLFGTASAAVIGFIMVIHLIKIRFNLIVRGYTLYIVFGWSFRLLAACLSTLTSLLLHKTY